MEKDATGHKFTLVVDMKKLVPGKSSTEKVGNVASTVWLNGDLQVVRKELEVKTPEGESKVVSEQSNFTKPLKFEAPKDAKDIITPIKKPHHDGTIPFSLTAISLPRQGCPFIGPIEILSHRKVRSLLLFSSFCRKF